MGPPPGGKQGAGEKDKGKGKEKAPRPIFDCDSINVLQDLGVFTCFEKRGVLGPGQVFEGPNHNVFAKGINIHSITGRGEDEYVVWVLNKSNSRKAIHNVFESFLVNEDRDFLYRNTTELITSGANTVFVEKTGGKPYGKYMSSICREGDNRRGAALLVAFFGRRNINPCDCCMTRMGKQFSDRMVPVMSPFFECRSIKGFHKNACANCIYFVEGGECDFNMYSFLEPISKGVSSRQHDFDGMPDSELTLGKYCQISTEYDFDEAREEAIGQITGVKPRSHKPKPEDRRAWE